MPWYPPGEREVYGGPVAWPLVRVRPVLLALTALALALVIGIAPTQGNAAGAKGAATSGCTCHAQAPNAQTTVNVTGLPANYTPGMNYTLEVKVQGPAALPVAQNQGGFVLSATAGTFASPDDTTQSGEDKIVTHTAKGNDQRSWPVTWTAPANGTGEVTFTLFGMAVNGNAVNDPLDAWNKAELKLPEAAPPPPQPAPKEEPPAPQETPGLGVLAAAAALAAVAAMAGGRRQG